MNTKKLTLTAMFTALVYIGTMMAIPIPKTSGILNLGDAIIIISSVILGPIPAAFAGAVGASLGDLTWGAIHYIPATFMIKGAMGFIIGYLARSKSMKSIRKSAIIAEIFMVGGYFVYELLFLNLLMGDGGFGYAIFGVPFNITQGIVAVVVAMWSIKYIRKNEYFNDISKL